MNDKECTIYCINSVKGGCGKTTVSLSIAYTIMYNLESEYMKEINNPIKKEDGKELSVPKVCYIDLDILGTGVEYVIFEEDSNLKYFNNAHCKTDTYDDFKQFINPIDRVDSNLQIDCILLSADPKEKSKFLKGNHNYDKAHNMNVFLKRSEKLLSAFIKGKEYDAIIIDSSPSYDDFPRSIYKYLRNISSDKDNNIKKVYNLFVSTLETSHVLTTISTLVDMIKDSEVNQQDIRVVFNDINNYFGSKDEKAPRGQFITQDEFTKEVVTCYNGYYVKLMRKIGDSHEPSLNSFNENSILYKKYSETAGKNVFRRSDRMSGSSTAIKIMDNAFSSLVGDE